MSEIPLLEDENAGSEQHNITTGDEQRRVSLTMEELHSMFEQVIEQKFVPLIYTIVKQEIGLAQDKILTSFKQNSGSGIHSSESRSFQLQFLTKISRPVFSNNIIKGERSTPITIALFDAITKEVVKFGPEASAKVEIVPVKDDFDCDKRSNWTLEEFNKYVAREKPGRKSLLTGNVYLNLKEGVGLVGDMSFTHNKNYLNKCNLRLGAKVVDNLDGTRIREAVTESFVVKDHRYTYNKKHRPPHLHDDVWRLDKILKGGAFHTRLSREKVNTVKDFLSLLYLDPTRLRNIVGRGMSPTMWGVTVAHAQTCVLDPTLKFYHPSGSQQETSVVFNVVGQVMGLLSECQYAPVDKLSETEKVRLKSARGGL